jgi:serine/threonine protein kinase
MATTQVLRRKYGLLRKLGAGGMGTVFLARHLVLEQQVAVKLLNAEAVRTPVLLERFLREARTLAAIRHPGVCQVFDADTAEDGQPFIVMEYLEGATLDQLGKQLPGAPIPERVRWVLEAAEGLAAAHERGVVHRDVKPSNLILAGPAPGRVKVLDFGVAKQLDDDRGLTGEAAIGTMKYMAPEQLLGQPVDARADVWALAVTLYQLLSRKLPFDGDSISAYMLAVVQHPPKPLTAHLQGAPPALSDAIARALQPLERRTPDMSAFIADLQQALRVSDTQARPTEPDLRPVPPPRRRSPLPGALAGLVGLGLVVALGSRQLLAREATAPTPREEEPRPTEAATPPTREVEPRPTEATPPPTREVEPRPTEATPPPRPAAEVPRDAGAGPTRRLPPRPRPPPRAPPQAENPDHL